MSLELTLLIWSTALAFVQMLIAALAAALEVGVPRLVGNRENLPPMTGWAGRAQRAYRNMLEFLLMFAILVLALEIANRDDELTGLGAQLFFWARCAYAIVYIVGIPWVRTAVWAVSIAGLLLIFTRLI
jgi:uncharacterized MAPEG superfamily protein